MSDNSDLTKLRQKAEEAKVTDLHAGKIMNAKPIVIFEGSKIHSAVSTLISHKISGAPVVDTNNHLEGVVTEYDLLMQTATQDVADPFSFTKGVDYVKEDTALKDLIVLFYKKKYRWVPVVDKNMKVVGIITRMDILKQLIKSK